jgi:hypothetical protein
MKQYLLYSITAAILFTGCKTSKDYLTRADEEKAIYDAVKQLNKKAQDEEATAALPILYRQVQERSLRKIKTYSSYTDIGRWDKIIGEYNLLQGIFDAIDNSAPASRVVQAVSYKNEIDATRLAAAADYYRQAGEFAATGKREQLKQAHTYYNTADKLAPGYKDARLLMDSVFENSIVTVLVNPLQDNSYFFNTGWGNTGYNFSNEYFQQNLVRELGGKNSKRYPARFYTEWEARRDGIQPDWVVDIALRNFDIPQPVPYNYTRSRSKQIETGKDTAGKPVYKTVYATLNVRRLSLAASGTIEMNITDVNTRKNIAYDNFSDTYNWQQETADYSGDPRALTSADWALINNSYSQPRRQDILNELYRNIYPRVKNKISYVTDW